MLPSGSVDGDPLETRLMVSSNLEIPAEQSASYALTLGGNRKLTDPGDTDLPGICDVWLSRSDAGFEVRRTAVNVDTAESEMALANSQTLLGQFSQAKPNFVNWDQFNPEADQPNTSMLTKLLLLLLVVLLFAEPILAYVCSFHAKPVDQDSIRFRNEHGRILNPRHTPVESNNAVNHR